MNYQTASVVVKSAVTCGNSAYVQYERCAMGALYVYDTENGTTVSVECTPLAMPQRKPKRTWKPAGNKVVTTKAQTKTEPRTDNARTRRQLRNGGARFVN